MMHIPVLKTEALQYLNPKPGENFIDATFGFGGHATAILEKTAPNGKVLGIEIDSDIYKLANEKSADKRLILINDSYINLKKIAKENNFQPINGILFDLGMSSWDIGKSGRGFSFQKDEPLDMRYLQKCQSLTAEEIINKWPKEEIAKIIKEYGEEKWALKIAEKIAQTRKNQLIKSSTQLAEIIQQAIPRKFQQSRIHPATRTFQALRIAVNNELENLKTVLPYALEILETGGKIAIISFHSLEDRIVKNFFREQAKLEKLKIVTKKPITASEIEKQKNSKSRSAKMRIAIKITDQLL